MSWRRAAIIGASGGIGAALADCLDASGTQVYRLARSATDPRMHIDIEDEASIAAAAGRLGEDGPLDLVIVATGLLHAEGIRPERGWRELSEPALARLFAVNAIGPALVAKHFLPLFPRAGRSAFAALSARVGSIGDNRLGGWHGYRASKAALNMLIKTLAIELGRTRPEALCIGLHPGTVATELSAPFQRNVAPESLFTPERSARAMQAVLDRLAPQDSGNCFDWNGQRIEP